MLANDEFLDDPRAPTRFRLCQDRRGEVAERRSLRRDLGTAITQEAFVLHYQPRVSLKTARPVAAEALPHWPHRKRGLVSPSAFMPLAEETGQIVVIGGWTLAAACAQAAAWPSLRLAVNVSGRQIQQGVLVGQITEALARSGLDPERLELEVNEAALLGMELETILLLSAVRDLGVGIVLDEFGGGHASLSLMKRLPLTAVKIDRSLARGLPADPEDAAIVRAMAAIGRALGLIVIAEGVETEAQRGFLASVGCDQAQGSLFARPMGSHDLAQYLADGVGRRAARRAAYTVPVADTESPQAASSTSRLVSRPSAATETAAIA